MNNQELQAIANTEVLKWLSVASAKYNRFFKMPSISLDLSGAVAGRWINSDYIMFFNAALMNANLDAFKSRTIPHEVSHLITHALYPYAKPHGHEWKSVMNTLGVSDVQRCHSYDTSTVATRRTRPYVYKCNCQEHKLTQTIHNKILRGQRRWCLRCKGTVVYIRTELTNDSTCGRIPV